MRWEAVPVGKELASHGGSGDKGMLYKAMLFGASRRNGAATPALWAQIWDAQKLGESNMIGWWEDDPAATATLVAAPPPPPPTPVPTPAADWKSYPHKSFSGPNVTPCDCHVPSTSASAQCECELCCPVQGESVLNISLAACEAACLGQGAATKHTAGRSCTAAITSATMPLVMAALLSARKCSFSPPSSLAPVG